MASPAAKLRDEAVTPAPGPARPRFALPRSVNLPGIAFAVVLVAAWQAAVSSGLVEVDFLPAPSEVARAWSEQLSSGQLVPDFLHTLSSALLGWAVGGLLGIVLGTALGLSARTWQFGMSTVEFLRAVPAICFVPVAAILLGFSLEMELLVTSYAALWPTLVNTAEGIRSTDGLLRDTGRTLHLSRLRQAVSIALPSAGASILVGLRLSLALSLMLAVVAEMVGNPAGMGYQLVMQQQALQTAAMFAYIVTIGVLGVALNAAFTGLVRLLLPGIMASLREDDR